MTKTISSRLREIQLEHDEKIALIIKKATREKSIAVYKASGASAEKMTTSEKVADGITRFSGSMFFLLLNAAIFFVWICVNTIPLGIEFFDPYPFSFLTLVVSLEAIFLSCFVLISQDRQAEKDRDRNKEDYLVDLKAEIEVRSLHQKLDLLLQEQIESQTEQLDMLGEIEKELEAPVKRKAKKPRKK